MNSKDSDLKQIGLRKVYVQRLLNLKVLRAKYSEVLSSETVPFVVYEDMESRWSYDEVFQHFTVYPVSVSRPFSNPVIFILLFKSSQRTAFSVSVTEKAILATQVVSNI